MRGFAALLVTATVMAFSLTPTLVTHSPISAASNTWKPPRTADGQPDIQGFWAAGGDATGDDIEVGTVSNVYLGRQFRATQMIVDPPDHKIPYQPWAAVRRQAMVDRRENPTPSELDPIARCYLPGVPRQAYVMSTMQILQAAGYVVVLSEIMHTYRIIPLGAVSK